MTKLGWDYDRFMDSTFYFYYGIVQHWLLSNGGVKRKKVRQEKKEKVYTFDQLPDGYW